MRAYMFHTFQFTMLHRLTLGCTPVLYATSMEEITAVPSLDWTPLHLQVGWTTLNRKVGGVGVQPQNTWHPTQVEQKLSNQKLLHDTETILRRLDQIPRTGKEVIAYMLLTFCFFLLHSCNFLFTSILNAPASVPVLYISFWPPQIVILVLKWRKS